MRGQEPIDYIRSNYERDDRLAVMLIKNGEVKHEFRSAERMVDEAYQAHLRAENANGANVYLTVNALRPETHTRTRDDVAAIRHVYLDIDTDGAAVLEKLKATDGIPEPHHVLETSPGKFQALWSVEGFERNEAERLTRNMAAHVGADTAVWDSARVLRLPEFRNWKYDEPHFVKERQTAPPAQIYTPRDFRQFPELAYSPAGQMRQERTGSYGGSQSEKDWAYALRALERGESPSVVQSRIAEYRRSDKPHADRYAAMTVEKATRYRAGAVSVGNVAMMDQPPARGPER